MELEFTKLESKPLCGTLGCSHYATYVCWTNQFTEFDHVEGLQVLRPLLLCRRCLIEIGGQI